MKLKNRKIKIILFVSIIVLLFFIFDYSAQAIVAPGADSYYNTSNLTSKNNTGTNDTPYLARPFVYAFNVLLYAVLYVISILIYLAGLVLDWVLNPAVIKSVLNNSAINDVWAIVRDLLNLAFILVLIFSAFATIFQIEKYHAKKIVLTLIIMALLVNFSLPISRFIIDSSNIIMYFFLNAAFGNPSDGQTIASNALARNFSVTEMFNMKLSTIDSNYLTSGRLIIAIIFGFLIMITFIFFAFTFVVRIAVLALLIVFSPVGFVAAIFPSSKNFSTSWWTQLFKQSFMGPILVFGLLFAIRFLEVVLTKGDGITKVFDNLLASNRSENSVMSEFVAKGIYFTLPIVTLWAVLIAGQKVGAMGAATAMNWGRRAGRWGGRIVGGMTGYNVAERGYHAYQARRKEARESGIGVRFGKRVGSAQDWVRSKMPFGKDAEIRYQRDIANRVEEEAKRNDVVNKSEQDLIAMKGKGNRFEKAAAIRELATRSKATETDLTDMGKAFGETSQVFKQLVNKVKLYNPAAAFAHIKDDTERQNTIKEFVNSNQFDYKKLKYDALGGPKGTLEAKRGEEFMRIALEEEDISVEGIEELRNRGGIYKENINRTIQAIADTKDSSGNYIYVDADNKANRNIQMAHLGLMGHQSSASLANDAMRKRMFKDMNEKTGKRLDGTNLAYLPEIEGQISPAKLGAILQNMEKKDIAEQIANYMRRPGGKHAEYMNTNPNLAGLYK